MLEEFDLNVDPTGLETLDAYSDKVVLPQRVLSSILEQFPGKLPHPLIFQIENQFGKKCCVGVKEFSSPDEVCLLPKYVSDKLDQPQAVRVSMIEIPKATSLKVRPAHFYTNVTNWKYFLENKLNKYYTCISNGVIVILDGTLRYELQIEEINGEKDTTACIVDTDVVLDVVPLNDTSANQQLAEMARNPHNNIVELENTALITAYQPFTNPKFIPKILKVDLTKYKKAVQVSVTSSDLVNVDIMLGLDKFLNMENFRNSTMEQDQSVAKRIDINLRDDDILAKMSRIDDSEDEESDAKWVYVVPICWEHEADMRIEVEERTKRSRDVEDDEEANELVKENVPTTVCSNCDKIIPNQKFQLHEVFCLKNNKKCPQCGEVFLKAIPSEHWHCECGFYTNSNLARFKHIKLNHSGPYKCTSCNSEEKFDTFTKLVTEHRSTNCPEKIHECQFCHLVVPQGQSTYQDNFENLTNHENQCGNKTNECYKCGKPCRVKDYKKHLQLHELDKLSFNQLNKISFNKCSNENCISLIGNVNNELGLCDLCYGPLFTQQHDPTHIKLQMRIERKYVMQLTRGCGQVWCKNEYCSTGSSTHRGKGMKEITEILREQLFAKIRHPPLPINKGRSSGQSNQFWFCVNESIAQKKSLLNHLYAEGEYDLAICYRAVNECREENAREWLRSNGVREVMG